MPDPEFNDVLKERNGRMVPMSRLVARIGLKPYNKPAPMDKREVLPEKLKIKLSQHIGAPGQPTVKVGDKVAKGQVIALVSEDKLGVNIHSPINGVVKDINNSFITIIRG
jgi:Na+-translocating ferredoxin:NAD+ oxidoreductase RnfC subunit